jgi:uncharacterized OB-fold protein
MTADTASTAPRFYEQTWDLSYRHALGSTVGVFLDGLAEGRIRGRRCPSCERVLVPPRSYCDRCSVSTGDWVDVRNEGVIEMMTIVYEGFKGLPDPPYAIAYVTLDGASTALLGYVRGVDLGDVESATTALAIGTRVRVHFEDQPKGLVTDYWFEPLETPTS